MVIFNGLFEYEIKFIGKKNNNVQQQTMQKWTIRYNRL